MIKELLKKVELSKKPLARTEIANVDLIKKNEKVEIDSVNKINAEKLAKEQNLNSIKEKLIQATENKKQQFIKNSLNLLNEEKIAQEKLFNEQIRQLQIIENLRNNYYY